MQLASMGEGIGWEVERLVRCSTNEFGGGLGVDLHYVSELEGRSPRTSFVFPLGHRSLGPDHVWQRKIRR